MIYRRFGRTELQMPVFSCGGMRFQYKWGDVPLDQIPPENQANLEATIRAALAAGVNHIETARGYGCSERQLGLILPKLPRQELFVQTKIAPCATGEQFIKEFEESLQRLQLDHVDLLAVHGVNTDELMQWTLQERGCLWAARQMQKRGLARFVGFSTHARTEQIIQVINHPRDGGFDYVNLHWYYIYQRNWPAVEAAIRKDMGVFIISPSDKGGMLYRPPARLVELCQPLHPMVFNDLFCLSHPQVHTLSVGAARPSDFDLHLQTLPHLSKPQEALAPIVARLEKAVRDTVGERWAKPFSLGLADWEETPGQINLPIILWLRNLVLAWGMMEFGQMRYNLLGNGGHWFPGLNAEKANEVDLSPALPPGMRPTDLLPLLAQTHQLLAKQAVKRLSQS